jgi:23S rRNA pseudouridine1911/1915/1917 synthase
MTKTIQLQAIIPPESSGQRLDQALATLFSAYSRSQLQRWITDGYILVNGETRSVRYKVQGGEEVVIEAPLTAQTNWQPQSLDLPVIYEDDSLIILNKPAGIVVHPAAGNPDNTLVNALLHHYPELAEVPRAGLIHRLDKDTTGLLVVARTLEAHHHLVAELQQHHIQREYVCIVQGRVISGGTIEQPLGRHPTQRIKRAVILSGKPAVTHYRVLERFAHHTALQVNLETGRTHQIRVHLAHLGFPVVGDPLYGRKQIPAGASPALMSALKQWHRQALHARRLQLVHPKTHEICEWTAPIPADFQALWDVLEKESFK